MWGLVVAGTVVLFALRRRSSPTSGWTPSAAEVNGWSQLGDLPGLRVHKPAYSWTTPAVARVMQEAGLAAQALGGELQLGDIGQKKRGVVFPPHESHRWGRDVDIGYNFKKYETGAGEEVDPRVVEALAAIAPWIDRVGVNASRAAAFKGAPYKVSVWDGHMGHLHLRLVPSLSAEPRIFTRGLARGYLGDVQEREP